MEMDKTASHKRGQIDWMITLVPLGLILALCIVFFFAPEQSNAVLSQVRFFFGDSAYIIWSSAWASSCCRCSSPGPNMEVLFWASPMKSRNIPSSLGEP